MRDKTTPSATKDGYHYHINLCLTPEIIHRGNKSDLREEKATGKSALLDYVHKIPPEGQIVSMLQADRTQTFQPTVM